MERRVKSGGNALRFAYADPPYVGQAKRYKGGVEVNHRVLVGWLELSFDGWALSCSSPSLGEVLSYTTQKVRILAWCKRYVPHRPWVWPTYAWEPVVVRPLPRRHNRSADTPFDYCLTDPGGFRRHAREFKQRILGEKPVDFVTWVLRCRHVAPQDEIVDVFPGSGAVGEAVDMWRRQGQLAFGEAYA